MKNKELCQRHLLKVERENKLALEPGVEEHYITYCAINRRKVENFEVSFSVRNQKLDLDYLQNADGDSCCPNLYSTRARCLGN